MFKLNTLARLTKKNKRIGRGGSRGGTSGRGTKGQKARTGHNQMRRGFEGGQMPLIRRLPCRGFNNARFRIEVDIVALAALQELFDDGAIIDRAVLLEHGFIKAKTARVKILGGCDLKKKLIVYADCFSKSAEQTLAKAGGQARKMVEGTVEG
jgi:large subunit ribosomal protein L15